MKNISVKVLSRSELEKLQSLEGKTAIISITDIGNKFAKLSDKVATESIAQLFIQFDDVLHSEEGHITLAQSELIAYFMKSLVHQKPDTIIVSCDGGVSRSAAVAAAILLRYKEDDMEIWSDGKFSPNRLVYELTSSSLGIIESLDIIDRKEKINLEKWKKLHEVD